MDKYELIQKEKNAFSNQIDPECIAQSNPTEPDYKIVGVKYEDKFEKKTFTGREYSYYTDLELEIGDIVEVPTRYGKSIAQVTRTDIDKQEIEKIKDYMKVIDTKLDKNEFLKEENSDGIESRGN